MWEKASRMLRLALVVVLGNALYAAAVTFFVTPSGLVLGGFTGLSIAISHFADIQVSGAVLIFHSAALIAGGVVLGKKLPVHSCTRCFGSGWFSAF
ncbi:MAG: YitT family protein [Clostridiaceae bacterium]|nr:YitT family protein [Clostridiaceae bacterium]